MPGVVGDIPGNFQNKQRRVSFISRRPLKGDNMDKLKIVAMVKINGQWVRQEDVPPEEFRKIVEKTMDRAMDSIGFDRVK